MKIFIIKGILVAYFIFNFNNFILSQSIEIKNICERLCSKDFFGRGYIKSGDSLSAIFLAEEFKKRNLLPFGESYFQDFFFDVNTFPLKMDIKINNNLLQPGVNFLMDPASNEVHKTWKINKISSNYLFQTNTQEIISDFKNKNISEIIIDARKYKSDSLRNLKSIAKGLTSYVDVILLVNEKLTFSVSTSSLSHSLIYIKDIDIKQDDIIETNIDTKFIKKHKARNVIALLPSKSKSNKYIIISAHYDHLGGMGESTYFPGANDNASGTSMLFSIAEKLKKKKLNKNILFIAFAGEEAGLIGSKFFVENPLIELKNIEFVLNIDIMGSGEDGITVVNSTEYPKHFNILEKINRKKKYLNQIKKRGKAANSDHYWFAEAGVPSFFIYTMGLNKNYHDINDSFENLSFSEFNDLTELIVSFLKKI